eukprot:Rmarinus@m.26815
MSQQLKKRRIARSSLPDMDSAGATNGNVKKSTSQASAEILVLRQYNQLLSNLNAQLLYQLNSRNTPGAGVDTRLFRGEPVRCDAGTQTTATTGGIQGGSSSSHASLAAQGRQHDMCASLILEDHHNVKSICGFNKAEFERLFDELAPWFPRFTQHGTTRSRQTRPYASLSTSIVMPDRVQFLQTLVFLRRYPVGSMMSHLFSEFERNIMRYIGRTLKVLRAAWADVVSCPPREELQQLSASYTSPFSPPIAAVGSTEVKISRPSQAGVASQYWSGASKQCAIEFTVVTLLDGRIISFARKPSASTEQTRAPPGYDLKHFYTNQFTSVLTDDGWDCGKPMRPGPEWYGRDGLPLTPQQIHEFAPIEPRSLPPSDAAELKSLSTLKKQRALTVLEQSKFEELENRKLTPRERAVNVDVARRRVVVENSLRRIKSWTILGDTYRHFRANSCAAASETSAQTSGGVVEEVGEENADPNVIRERREGSRSSSRATARAKENRIELDDVFFACCCLANKRVDISAEEARNQPSPVRGSAESQSPVTSPTASSDYCPNEVSRALAFYHSQQLLQQSQRSEQGKQMPATSQSSQSSAPPTVQATNSAHQASSYLSNLIAYSHRMSPITSVTSRGSPQPSVPHVDSQNDNASYSWLDTFPHALPASAHRFSPADITRTS